MATAYSDSHARIQAHRRAHPKQPPRRGLHDSTPPTHKTTITGTQRPAISSIHTHTQSRGRIRSAAAAAQITAHSQRDDGNDDDDDHGKGPAAIKLLFQLHPLDGRPINPNNNQASIQQPPKENNPSRENRQTKCAVTKCYLIDRAHCSPLPTIKFLAQSTLVIIALKILKKSFNSSKNIHSRFPLRLRPPNP
jgi:hypothetical protein